MPLHAAAWLTLQAPLIPLSWAHTSHRLAARCPFLTAADPGAAQLWEFWLHPSLKCRILPNCQMDLWGFFSFFQKSYWTVVLVQSGNKRFCLTNLWMDVQDRCPMEIWATLQLETKPKHELWVAPFSPQPYLCKSVCSFISQSGFMLLLWVVLQKAFL